MKAIKITEKTFNKIAKAKLLNLLPTTVEIEKKHVDGFGYVFFAKDSNNKILCKVAKCRDGGIIIYID